jgi:hypothetical protein
LDIEISYYFLLNRNLYYEILPRTTYDFIDYLRRHKALLQAADLFIILNVLKGAVYLLQQKMSLDLEKKTIWNVEECFKSPKYTCRSFSVATSLRVKSCKAAV